MAPIDDEALSAINVRELQGSYLFDTDGEVIGKIGDVLVDSDDKPQWLLVSFGAFLHDDRIVPVFDLTRQQSGYSVDYDKERVKHAPVVSMTSRSEDDDEKLNAYWCAERQVALPRACTIWTA